MELKLYPVDYQEPEPTSDPGWPKDDAGFARDEEGALALIRNAVPKAGEPLTMDELIALVCGRYVRASSGSFLPMEDAPDASLDLPAAIAAARAGRPLRGPASFASFTGEEVGNLVRAVINERKPTWKLRSEVVEVAPEKLEFEELER